MTQRAAWLAIAPTPSRLRRHRPNPTGAPCRHSWLRHAVQTSVSDRVRSRCITAMIWAIAPPIDATDDVGPRDTDVVEDGTLASTAI